MNNHSVETGEAFSIVSDQGKGRAFILIYEQDTSDKALAEGLANVLATRGRVLTISAPRITAANWQQSAINLYDLVANNGVRQASYVSFGEAGSLVQAIALRDLKPVRTLILVNATTRPHPSWQADIMQRFEHSLPLGLPFRSDIEGFDSKPLLQRIRCPVLVATTKDAASYLQSQAQELSEGLPTAWQYQLTSNDQAAELTKVICEFQEIPAKCPQKKVNA